MIAYSVYKYFNIIELEKTYAKTFSNINPSTSITLAPPLLKKYNRKLCLAYLVLPEPQEIEHHIGVCRPIGVILQNRKNGKIIDVINCKDYEFVENQDDFNREYYDLESTKKYWPNTTPENEEEFRLLLEQLFTIVKGINIFKSYNTAAYMDYMARVYALFPNSFHIFFDALQDNDFYVVNDDIECLRSVAKKKHDLLQAEIQEKNKKNNNLAWDKFLEYFESEMRDFVKGDIIPTLRSKKAYTKIDFYIYMGKMLKDLRKSREKFFNCYNVSQTHAAISQNRDNAVENQKVLIVKTYSKACVKPHNEDSTVNEICETIIEFLKAQLEEEDTGAVTPKTKGIISTCLNRIELLISELHEPTAIVEMRELFAQLQKDYFDMPAYENMSDLYHGYELIYVIENS